MAEERIETLSIGIESDAQKAVNGIERLADKMLSLEKATAKTESGLSSFANFFRGFSNSFKDLDNISKAAKPFSQLADIVGKVNKSSISLDTGNALKSINSIGEKIKNLSSVEDGLSVGLKKQILALERQNNAYDAQKKKIESLKARIESLSGQKIETEEYSALTRKIEFLKENLASAISVRDGLVENGWSGAKIENYNKKIDESVKKLADLKQQQEQMLSSGTAFEVNDLDKLTGELEIAEARLSQIGKELGVNLESLTTNLSAFAVKNEKTKKVVESFGDVLKNLPIAEVRLKDPGKLEAQIERLETRLDELRAKLQRDIMVGKITPTLDNSAYRDSLTEIAKVEKTINATKEKLKQLGQVDIGKGIGSFGKDIESSSTSAGKGLDGLSRKMQSTAAAITKLSKMFNALLQKIGRLGASLAKFAVKSFRGFTKSIGKAVSSLASLGKAFSKVLIQNKKSNASFGGLFKTILKLVVGVNILRAAFNTVKRGFLDGIDNLVQYSSEVNHSVSLLTSALGSLKNALAVAFAPIVNIVAPYLTKFINLLTSAFNAVGRFFAALTGKKIATQATKFYKDYAESLNGVGGAAKDASKALQSLGIDELNVLNQNEDEDDGGGGVDIEDMFTDVAIEGAISDWARKIREAFLNQDWEGLGKTIAEMANAGLRKLYDAIVDITPKVEQALKNFAKVFNSFVEYFDWELLGRTIGAGVNLISKSINALLGDDGIDFENLGRKISLGFRGMIDEIEWRELGNAIGNWFMVAWRIAEGFIEDMWRINPETFLNGWEELGIAVGEAVNGIFDRIKFDQIARVITDGFRGILEAAANALDAVHFDVIAANINKGLEALANGLKWENISEQITKFTNAVSKAFNDLLEIDFGLIGTIIGEGITAIVRAFNQLTDPSGGLDFEQLGINIANGFRNLFANIPWEELGNTLGNGFMIGWRILNGFIAQMSQQNDAGLTGFTELGIALGNAINGLFHKIDFGQIGTILANGFNAAIEILKNFIATIEWSDVAANLSNGLNNMIHGINWAEAGATLSDLVVKLLGVFQQVAAETDWEAFGRGIGVFLSNIDWKTIIGKVFDILWTVFSGFISGLFDTKAGKVFLAFVAGLTALKGAFDLVDLAIKASKWITLAADTLGGLKNLILTKVVPGVSGAIGTLSNLFSNIVTAAQGAFSGAGILTKIGSVIFSPTGLLIAGVAAGALLIIANWDKIKEVAKNLWENVLVPFGNFLKDTFTKIWENILAPALSYLSETILPPLMNIFSNLWNEILVPLGKFVASTLGPVFQTFGKILGWLISDVVAPVAKAFTDVLGGALETVSDIVGDVGKVLQGLIDFITGVFTGDWEKAWEGVKNIFKGIFNLIPDIAEGVINSVIRFINGIINGLNNVTGLVGIPSIPNIPEVNLPRLKDGGLIMSHMVAEIGEYGRREAILPLENRKSMSMIADSILNNANGIDFGNNHNSDELLQEQNSLLKQLIDVVGDGKIISVNVDGREIVRVTDSARQRMGANFSTPSYGF